MFHSPYTDPLVRQQNNVSLVLKPVFGVYFFKLFTAINFI